MKKPLKPMPPSSSPEPPVAPTRQRRSASPGKKAKREKEKEVQELPARVEVEEPPPLNLADIPLMTQSFTEGEYQTRYSLTLSNQKHAFGQKCFP